MLARCEHQVSGGRSPLVVAAGLISGCSSAKKAVPPPACRPAHPAQYRGTSAALGDADAGGTYCVVVGETLSVTLHVPPGDTGPPWQPLTASDASVLAPSCPWAQ